MVGRAWWRGSRPATTGVASGPRRCERAGLAVERPCSLPGDAAEELRTSAAVVGRAPAPVPDSLAPVVKDLSLPP